jgi:uncharacterized membrane protein
MNKTNDTVVRFREVQRFRQKWLWFAIVVVMLGLIISFGYGMIKQLVLDQPWGNRPMSDTALAIVGPFMILIGIGISWLFLKLKLLVEVREDGVYIRFAPLASHTVLFGDIVSCEARTYRPMREYGGWGVKYGRAGKAYNVSGNRAVQLKLSSGKGLLIGSQRPEELAQAIQAGMRG